MNNIVKIALGVVGLGAVSAGTWYLMKKSGSSEQLKYIPANAMVVGSINLADLHSKVDMDKVKKTRMWKQMEKQLDRDEDMEVVSNIIKEPENSGIDFRSSVYFYATTGKRKMESGALVLALADDSKFEKIVRKANIKGTIKKETKYQYAKLEHSGIIGWNSNTAVIMSSDDEERLEKDLDNAMVQDKKDCILSNPLFDELKGSSGDCNVWVNFAEVMEMQNMGEDFNDMYEQMGLSDAMGMFTLTFEKNDVKLSSRFAAKDKAKLKEMNVFRSSGISESHYKTLSPDDVFGALSLSLDMPALFDRLSSVKGFKSSLADLTEELDMSRKDLENLFTGEISLALVGFDNMFPDAAPSDSSVSATEKSGALFHTVQSYEQTPSDEEATIPYTDEPGSMEAPMIAPYQPYRSPFAMLPDMVLSLSAKDPAVIERLLKKKGLEKNEDGFYALPGMVPMFVMFTESGMSVTNSKSVAMRMKKKSAAPKEFAGKSVLTSSASALWMDLDLKHYPGKLRKQMKESMGSNDYRRFEMIFTQLDHLESSGKGTESNITLKMKDGEKSSLMRLLEMADDMDD